MPFLLFFSRFSASLRRESAFSHYLPFIIPGYPPLDGGFLLYLEIIARFSPDIPVVGRFRLLGQLKHGLLILGNVLVILPHQRFKYFRAARIILHGLPVQGSHPGLVPVSIRRSACRLMAAEVRSLRPSSVSFPASSNRGQHGVYWWKRPSWGKYTHLPRGRPWPGNPDGNGTCA